jgi:hypothetical protein
VEVAVVIADYLRMTNSNLVMTAVFVILDDARKIFRVVTIYPKVGDTVSVRLETTITDAIKQEFNCHERVRADDNLRSEIREIVEM